MHTDSFANKLIIEKSLVIMLLYIFDEFNFPHFYFYAVKSSNLESFSQSIKNQSFDLKKFGLVLKHGIGVPNSDVWDEMKKEYGLEKDKIVIIDTSKKN